MAGPVTEIAVEFRNAMEQRLDRSTTHLFLSEGHIDHIFASGAFSDVEVEASSGKQLFDRQRGIKRQ